MEPLPFRVFVDEAELASLRGRLRATRWPTVGGVGWNQGVDPAYLREVVRYWADEFDWRAQERRLNGFAHFHMRVSDVEVHFVHERAVGGPGVPIVLTHGWPSTFAEYLPVVPLLTARGFDVVVPSLPGYGFTARPDRPHTMRDTARLWRDLMHGLGYSRFAAHGGDFGAGVTTFLGLDFPEDLLGLHLSNLELDPDLGPGSPPLSDAEHALIAAEEDFVSREGGYNLVQSTKPLTLGHALADSPVGLAAWILEKWRAWSDCHGSLEPHFTRDDLLTTLTLYWTTNTITTSLLDFHDNRPLYDLPLPRVTTPTAIALFDNEHAHQGHIPRTWAARLYNLQRWNVMPTGGHFAATEEPEALATDLAAFFL
ncbi:epoxide hydrolase family protein [Actinokineospora cianjurensis]|uniref:Pimeloyl-ACP methyl ester carboxylesterase n=1 Tax=Actinokineospora cianjurensis TaxID=585224 RepID=A0A421B1Q0_9PSEU|nr:epoxide hydrolase family protein [Actinokineospora cianjurensis]RLK58211.1 pimeloyl-ACP methyl ester carboxylesterase [Actinokineospora cianjurensis]